jgi:hypothetical protein
MPTQKWDIPSPDDVQTDNSVEAMLRKSGVSSRLETCGPTSGCIAVFGAKTEVKRGINFETVLAALSEDAAVMIHLVKPRHYLCAVNFADGALIYRDPWPARTGTEGFNLKMLKAESLANVRDSIVVAHPKG